MGLFSDPGDAERRENLKQLEDKRVAFAQALSNKGFKPERMLFAQTENGGFTAIARFGGKQWLVASPAWARTRISAWRSASTLTCARTRCW